MLIPKKKKDIKDQIMSVKAVAAPANKSFSIKSLTSTAVENILTLNYPYNVALFIYLLLFNCSTKFESF